jgi:hypothetical protein
MMRRFLPPAALSVSILLMLTSTPSCGGGSSTGSSNQDDGGGYHFGGGASGGASSGSSGASSGSGTSSGAGGSGGGGGGVTATCIVGTRGCLCDTTGGCAAGLKCSSQSGGAPSLCCNGTDCSPAMAKIAASCTATGAASCGTPGITIPMASGTNDNCGYPGSSFNESITLCGIEAVGGGKQPAVVRAFYSDEHALTLGCATSTYPVSPLNADPDSVSYPQTGDPACVDNVMRPLRPVLYVTDITGDPSCTAGDLQSGGKPYDPVAVFGTWKSATEGANNQGTPVQMDPMSNGWNLGTLADPVSASVMACAGLAGGGGSGGGGYRGGGGGGGFGAELRFEVGLVSGHSYRLQVMVHDGDQTRGGDSGEACAVFCAGTGSSCEMATCGPGLPACPAGLSCVAGCCTNPGGPVDAGPDGPFLQ